MSAVYVSNLVINAGSTFTQTFTLEQSSVNSELDLTGYEVKSQLKKWSGSKNAIDFTVTIVEPFSTGRIILSLTSEQTKNIKPGRYIYDVLITDPYSIKNRVIEGTVLVREGATE